MTPEMEALIKHHEEIAKQQGFEEGYSAGQEEVTEANEAKAMALGRLDELYQRDMQYAEMITALKNDLVDLKNRLVLFQDHWVNQQIREMSQVGTSSPAEAAIAEVRIKLLSEFVLSIYALENNQ